MISLDLRGLDCPVPLMRTKQQLTESSPGDIIEVKSTSDQFASDVHLLCDAMKCNLIDLRYNAGVIIAKIQK